MPQSPEAYVDTSALIAFADRSDTWHALFCRLFSDPPRLITSPLVVAEGHGWFLKRYDRTKALQFLAMVESIDTLRLIPTDARAIEAATKLMRHFSDQDLTLVDAVGLHAMDTRKTGVCWSTDRHLAITGAKLAIHLS